MDNTKKLHSRILVSTLSLVTIILLGFLVTTSSIGTFYHSNATEGNYGSKYLWLFMLGTLFNLIYIIYLGFKEDENSKIKKLYLAGLVLIFISIGFYFATLTPRKNNIEYSLSNERYSIPWEYNPAQSGAPANSEYVTIHVSYPLFNSQYSDENYLHERLAITKSIIDKKYMKGEPLDTYCLTEPCKSVTNDLNTYFIDNNFIYKVSYHGQGITFVTKNELENFKIKIINLFETFKVQ